MKWEKVKTVDKDDFLILCNAKDISEARFAFTIKDHLYVASIITLHKLIDQIYATFEEKNDALFDIFDTVEFDIYMPSDLPKPGTEK